MGLARPGNKSFDIRYLDHIKYKRDMLISMLRPHEEAIDTKEAKSNKRKEEQRRDQSRARDKMMFWKSSTSTSSSALTVTSSSKASANAVPSAAASVSPAIPAYVLSEQRRNELLLAARANRVSWIDGVDETSSSVAADNTLGNSLYVGKARTLGKHAGTSIPPHCQQALEAIATDLHDFFGSLETLKSKIIPNSIMDDDATVRAQQTKVKSQGADGKQVQYRTVFQDLYENATLLDKWQRTQGHEISSPVRRKRMTGDDKEMVFLLAFKELIAVLKNPKAAELVYQIQSFVKKFDTWDLKLMLRQRATSERPGGLIQTFVDKLVQQLRHNDKLLDLIMDNQQHQQEADNNSNDSDQMLNMVTEFLCGNDEWSEDLLREVLEAFLMEKVYVKALTPSPKAEQEDRVLFNRLQSLAFVEFQHLDLPTPNTEELKQAWHHLVLQLKQMPLYMSPRRKMDCVLRVCQELTKLLASQKADGRFPSADEFLPGLIYLLLKANPRELKRNLNFILEYRNPGKLVSEPGYFFTHLVSSVAFLEQVNGSLLTISPEEFEDGLRRCKQQILVDVETNVTTTTDSTDDNNSNSSSSLKDKARSRNKKDRSLPTVLEVRAKRLAMMASLRLKMRSDGELQHRQCTIFLIQEKPATGRIVTWATLFFLFAIGVEADDGREFDVLKICKFIHFEIRTPTKKPLSHMIRFPKYKTQAAQGRGESTAKPKQQQQLSYLRRVRSQFTSFRVPYQSKTSSKNTKRKSAHGEDDATAAAANCKQDELRPADQDLVYHLGNSDSEYYTVSQYLHRQPSHDNPDGDQCAADNSSSKKQTPRYHLFSWGEAKTRIQQTTSMIRDVCVTTSSALLSTAWRVYPRNNEDVSSPAFSPSSSSSSGADTPPPKRRMKEKEQYEQWLMMTAGRESEISICMSYYSSRSLSDTATDNEDHQRQVNKMRSSSRGSRSSFSSGSTPRASENNPFRSRGSSTDSYKTIYNERLSSGRNEDTRRSHDEEEREDFDDEIIRDSLFLLNGKPYTVKNEWI